MGIVTTSRLYISQNSPASVSAGTGHAGEFVVHAEIVLEGDGTNVCVAASTFTPSLARWPDEVRRCSASLHDTSVCSSTILILLSSITIFHIFFKECVCLEELVDGVHTLGLYGVVLHGLIFLLLTKRRFERLVALDL